MATDILPQTMQDFGKWITQQGTKLVDMTLEPLKKTVRDFNDCADKTEAQKIRFETAKETYQKAGLSWPTQYADTLKKLTEQVSWNRDLKLKVLRALAKAKANPKDYGLTVVGLTKAQVDSAYPGLIYDPASVRIGVVQVIAPLVIEATIIVALAAAITYMSKMLVESQKVDFAADMTKELMARGLSADQAAKQAKNLLEGTQEPEGGFLSDLKTLFKWGAIGTATYYGGKLAYTLLTDKKK